ncbi:MAG TPA: hypothetical protein VK461_02745 [Acidimicrobiales bacterium]|nr:hypothetical protein [Acidimicrobiales bacterium]
MATRKLIVAALCCGLAILLAGGLWLVATAKDESRTSPLLSIGESATVGDLVLTVTSSDLTDGALATVVDVSLSSEASSAVGDLARGWSAVSPSGQQLSLVAPPLPSGAPPLCAATTVAPGATEECLLFFGSEEGTASSTGYTLVYKAADGAAAWVVT